MLEDDPFTPKPKAAAPLETLSVQELEARVAGLKAEIVQCEALIAQKKAHLAQSAALFGAKRS